MINSEKSSDCGRSSQTFLPVLRRPFGIESQGANAFSKESRRTPSPVLALKATVTAATSVLAVEPFGGVIRADHDRSDDRG
jgi:hypothetical protein